MNKKLEQELVKKYPKIFKDYGGDMRQTCMHWGMEHGDGWYTLLDEMCDFLEGVRESNKHLPIPQVVADQVKEKFGGLRFYHHTEDSLTQKPKGLSVYFEIDEYCHKRISIRHWKGFWEFWFLWFKLTVTRGSQKESARWDGWVDGVIDFTESISFAICEICGNPGKPNKDGYWVSTLCDECRSKPKK